VTPKGEMKVTVFLFGWLMKCSSCDDRSNEIERLREFCLARPMAKKPAHLARCSDQSPRPARSSSSSSVKRTLKM